MRKITGFLLVGLVAVGLVSGIIKIQFHPENVATLATWGSEKIGTPGALEPYRAKFVDAKRNVELKIFSDPEKKMDLSIAYAKADSERLKTLLDKQAPHNQLLDQTTIVLKSLRQLEEITRDAKIEHLADNRPKIKEVFLLTQDSMKRMREGGMEIDYIQSELAAITGTVEKYIGNISADEPAVAGAKDENK